MQNTHPGTGRRAPDIQLLGPVLNVGTPNRPGEVRIESTGGISSYSTIEAGDLYIDAKGNFSQSYIDTFFNIGGVPRQHWGALAEKVRNHAYYGILIRSYPYVKYLFMTVRIDDFDDEIAALLATRKRKHQGGQYLYRSPLS